MYLIKTVKGDITKITDVQAIVNAANNSLLGVELMVPFTGQQDRNFWQNVGLFMVVRQVRQRLQKHIICHAIM